jgi:hypothetical protein
MKLLPWPSSANINSMCAPLCTCVQDLSPPNWRLASAPSCFTGTTRGGLCALSDSSSSIVDGNYLDARNKQQRPLLMDHIGPLFSFFNVYCTLGLPSRSLSAPRSTTDYPRPLIPLTFPPSRPHNRFNNIAHSSGLLPWLLTINRIGHRATLPSTSSCLEYTTSHFTGPCDHSNEDCQGSRSPPI